MLIQRGQTIGGFDIVEVRRVLADARESTFSRAGFASIVPEGVDSGQLFDVLVEHGYLEEREHPDVYLYLGPGEDTRAARWGNSIAGQALAKARIGKPMPRAKAERLLAEALERVRVYNDGDEAYWIDSVDLFGSLSVEENMMIGDVDLRVVLSRKVDGEEFVRRAAARSNGDLLRGALQLLVDVRRAVTGGSKLIDVQVDEGEPRDLPDDKPPRPVYLRKTTS